MGDGAHIVLKLRASQEKWLAAKVVPACFAAGLNVRAFAGAPPLAGRAHVFAVISAPLSRLLLEAERLNYPLLLDARALRDADVAANRALAARGVSFDPSGRDSEHGDVAIPPLPPSNVGRALPCLRRAPLDPYAYVYAPYRAAKRHLFAVNAETGVALSRTDALKLLREAIEAPADVHRGAGLNLDRLRVRRKIVAHYVEHDPAAVAELERRFDVDGARAYYGEETALYLSFVSFLGGWLVLPALVGVGLFAHQVVAGTPSTGWLPAFGIFVSLWATLLHERWKRLQSRQAMRWGMSDFKASEPLRPEFMESSAVTRERSVVTGRPAYVASRAADACRRSTAGVVVATFLGAVVVLVGSIFVLRVFLTERDADHGGSIPAGWGAYISAVVNAVQIQVLDVVYGYLARALTSWENHPTTTRHTNSLILKLAVFRAINSYFSLLYIAAIKGHISIGGQLQQCANNSDGVPDCMSELQSQLAILLITRFLLIVLFGVAWPAMARALEPCTARCCIRGAQKQARLREAAAKTSATESAARLLPDSVFDGYLDVIINLGYVSLFVSAFPLAPALVLIFALATHRIERYRLLHLVARPFPRGAQDIGAWEKVFEVMSYLSTVTNLAIVVFTNTRPLFGSDWSWGDRLAFFVAAEHGVLVAKWLLERYIPDRSYSVRVQLQRSAYLVQKHIFGVDLAGTSATLVGADAAQEADGEDDEAAVGLAGASPAPPGSGDKTSAFRVADSYEDMVGAQFRGLASG